MAEIDIADENLAKLNRLQEIIRVEDGIESSMDEALARILDFYGKFVPYNRVAV
jgi:hypothetical protein